MTVEELRKALEKKTNQQAEVRIIIGNTIVKAKGVWENATPFVIEGETHD